MLNTLLRGWVRLRAFNCHIKLRADTWNQTANCMQLQLKLLLNVLCITYSCWNSKHSDKFCIIIEEFLTQVKRGKIDTEYYVESKFLKIRHSWPKNTACFLTKTFGK